MSQAKMYEAGETPNQHKQDAAMYGGNPAPLGNSDKENDKAPKIDDFWLLVARDAYNDSESFYNANIRSTHEKNLAHFQSRHAPGSKYYTASYQYRHKSFRPKTRAFVRRQESQLLKSMFSTSDFVTVKASRSTHPSHRVSADINQLLLQYRLSNTMPWFQTVLGAYQDTLNMGLCISHQFWNYEEEGDYRDPQDIAFDGGEEKPEIPPIDMQDETREEDGDLSTPDAQMSTLEQAEEVSDEMDEQAGIELDFAEILKDTPDSELRPAENIFFSIACDWRDPANSSPFIIDKIAMYIDDVKAMARRGKWYELTEGQLLTGVASDYDAVRRAREGNREDSKDRKHLHRGFDTVWVHRNIIKKDGVDWIYYTLGVHYRLSQPVPLREDPDYKWLRPGERPYIIGFSTLEAHKNYPDSLVGISGRTQQDANELNNQRFDNVALSLNRRYIVKRAAMIDYAGLQRNVPGGVTETDDPNNDIKIENPPDVTQSSYEEQNRINSDFDELVGMFSGSSVGNNRQMNETVGGMKLLAGDADSLSEYPMMVFMITWVIPVLKQIVRLEQTYESDGALLNLMGEKLKLWQQYGIDRVTDKWIQGSMNLEVAAGFGAANPEQRIQRLAAGFGIIGQLAPALAPRADGEEIAKEVLGALGYQGIERFYPEGGPKMPAGQMPQDEGAVNERDQAELDQDMKKHQELMAQKDEHKQMDMEMRYLELESKAEERLLKGEIDQRQYDATMTRIQTDRQNKVDEMKIKLREGTGI